MQSIRLFEAEERKTRKKLDRPYDYTFNRTLIYLSKIIRYLMYIFRCGAKTIFFLGG